MEHIVLISAAGTQLINKLYIHFPTSTLLVSDKPTLLGHSHVLLLPVLLPLWIILYQDPVMIRIQLWPALIILVMM